MNIRERLWAYVRLIRPINAFMMGLAVVVGAVLTKNVKALTLTRQLLLGFVTGVFLTGASMAMNDYYDREIDAVNEPSRPIPSGAVKPKSALALALMLALIGLLAAFLTSLVCGLTALMAWLVTSTYVTIGKRTGLPGNLMVSFCVALPFLYGSLAISQGVSLNVGLFAAMAFLSNTGREINKGIVDVAGDKERNIQTIAVRFGNKVAAMLAALCYLSAVSLSVLPLVLNIVSWLFIPFIAVTDFGLILSSLMLLQSPSREKARKIKKVVLLFFLFGLFGFISGSL